jgi:homospermidine synthase
MRKCLIYSHPAVPPAGIRIGEWYTLDELKERFSIEYITKFFQPANFGWEECEEIFPRKKKVKNKNCKNKN